MPTGIFLLLSLLPILLGVNAPMAADLPQAMADAGSTDQLMLDCQGCHRQFQKQVGQTRGGHDTLIDCLSCHDSHGIGDNLHLVKEVIDTPNSGPRNVLFTAYEGSNSFADGDGVYDGVCEVCHTTTNHHHNDASGDHSHYAGADCRGCHDHWNDFQPTGIENHPQAATDCGNCHLDQATGAPDLLGTHSFDCASCHPTDFTSTILGPLGTWNLECSACHNPAVPETGSLPVPTKGHRCTLCHGQQMTFNPPAEMHQEHADKTNCVVCHGFIPEVGTVIGSGNRDVCRVCHDEISLVILDQVEFHERHVPMGVSCLECHGGQRPPIDVVDGPPVGQSTNVCQICHDDQEPADFWPNIEEHHQDHGKESIDCGACHIDAELQDDRDPMPPLDDPVRASLNRIDYNECYLCHENGQSLSAARTHFEHVAEQWQWCHNCHEATDQRPQGLLPPVTVPADSCLLCHDDQTYTDAFPFDIHEEHAGDVKCYACHQTSPSLFGWPDAFMGAPPAASLR